MANKFTYDTTQRHFNLSSGVTQLDAKADFYSWIKSDWQSDASLNKFAFPVRPIGGEDVGGGSTISPYYQLLHGWKIHPAEEDHELIIVGNIITVDGSSPVSMTEGDFNVIVRSVVSANSLTNDVEAAVDAQDLADAVWDEPVASHSDPSKFGGFIATKLLTVSKFLGLK